MRYLVKAKVKKGKQRKLLRAIETGILGQGSVAGGEYLRDMQHARLLKDGTTCWVEVCFCNVPLEEELPYWEEYFDVLQIKNAHNRDRCKDLNGTEAWACVDCDCTERLELRMAEWGDLLLPKLKKEQREEGRKH